MYEVFEDEKIYYLVLQICEGREVFQRIKMRKRLIDEQMCTVLVQVLRTFVYLHVRGIGTSNQKVSYFTEPTLINIK